MFNIPLDYPSYKEEIEVVKGTTSSKKVELRHIVTGAQIVDFQQIKVVYLATIFVFSTIKDGSSKKNIQSHQSIGFKIFKR